MRKYLLLNIILAILILSGCYIDDNPELPSYCELRPINMYEYGSIVNNGQITGQLENDLCADAYGTITTNPDSTKTIEIKTLRLVNSEITGVTTGEIELELTADKFLKTDWINMSYGSWNFIFTRNNFYISNVQVSSLNILQVSEVMISCRLELSYTLTTQDGQTIDTNAELVYDEVQLESI